jgi:hypothetical protein
MGRYSMGRKWISYEEKLEADEKYMRGEGSLESIGGLYFLAMFQDCL